MMDRDPEYLFNFPFPDSSIPAGIVSFDDVHFNYPAGPELFSRLNFGIDLDTRAAIVGPNGVGPPGHEQQLLLFMAILFKVDVGTMCTTPSRLAVLRIVECLWRAPVPCTCHSDLSMVRQPCFARLTQPCVHWSPPDVDPHSLCSAGIGKSTLLGLISGTLEATKGRITRNSSVRMATFSQHHMDGLELHLSPLQYFSRVFLNEKEEKLRSHLSNFGISGELALQSMYTLSGGQKSRVAFAKVCISAFVVSCLPKFRVTVDPRSKRPRVNDLFAPFRISAFVRRHRICCCARAHIVVVPSCMFHAYCHTLTCVRYPHCRSHIITHTSFSLTNPPITWTWMPWMP
jgi:energy-coupling factor transporter ATP-binding protein EcfA2